MPFLERENPRARTLLPTGPERERPDFFGDTVPAAFRQENTVNNIARVMREHKGFEPEEGYDPVEHLRGTRYEANYLDRVITSQSSAETEHMLRQIDREEEDRETIAASGFSGVVASIAAGIIDPTIALPGGALYRTARGGVSIGRTAMSVGGAGAAAAGVAEGVLGMTQETRTREEMALNIGVSTILSGLLGAGAGALVSRGERRAIERMIESDITTLERTAVPEVPAAAMRDPANSNQVAAEVGAAPTDQRVGLPVSTALDSVFGPAQRSPITAIARSPTQSLLRSELQASRRIVGDLAESPLMTVDAERGVTPTRAGGPTADREIRLMQGQTRIAMMDMQENAWLKHRYGSADSAPRFARQRDALSEMMGRSTPGKLTYAQFDEEVGRAMRQGDTHPIPEVAEAAQARRAVFDEWRDRAIRAGLYGEEGADPRTAPSYFPRLYLKDAIIERKPQVSRAFADWLEAEQVRKRNIENRIEELEAQLGAPLSPEQTAAIYRAIETELEAWGGKSARAALSSIRARDKAAAEAGRAADAPRLRGADRDIRSAVRRILGSDRDMSRQELEARADEIVDRIVGTPAGRLPYDEAPLNVGGGAGSGADAPRGALARREFMIPDEELERLGILDNSAERGMDAFLRTTVPDIILTERFGDFSMSVQLKSILDEANNLIKRHP